MAIGLVKDSNLPRDGSHNGFGGIADERSLRERAVRPSEGIPNGGAHVLAACASPGQLDYFVTLALQQHGEQSALRKGRGQFSHNVGSFCFFSRDWTNFRRFRGLCLWDLGPIRLRGVPSASGRRSNTITIS